MVRQKEDTEGTVKDIIVRSLKQPSCTNAKSEGKTITIDIEKELGIEIVGDTKIKVAVSEDEEPWDIIDESEYSEETEKEINQTIKEDYLSKNEKQKENTSNEE